MAEDCTADSGAVGVCVCGGVSVAGEADVADDGDEPARWVAPGVWLRAYASGYVRKNAELTTSGPYAYTRNPLYLGSMMIAFGFAWASALWWIAVLLAVLFAVIYVPTIRGEEAYLRGQFPEFDAYAAQVPRLLPRLTAASTTSQGAGSLAGGFSRELYLKHREYNAAGKCGGNLARRWQWAG